MYARILVPVDGSATSRLGLQEALKLAKVNASRLCLFHIVNELVFAHTFDSGLYADKVIDVLRTQGREILDQTAALVQRHGVPADTVLAESIGGSASRLIIEQAHQWAADLIVMGTHGRRGVRRLALGSDAEDVVRSAMVPVLLVRSTGDRNDLPLRGAA